MITYPDQPYNLTAEFDPEENDQAFDIVILNRNKYPGDYDTDTDEKVIDNNEGTIENCNKFHVSEDYINVKDFSNDNYSYEDGNFERDIFIDISHIDNLLTTTDNPILIIEHDNDDVGNNFKPKANAIEETFEVIEEISKDRYISGHIILNQCGYICSHPKHHIKSYQL